MLNSSNNDTSSPWRDTLLGRRLYIALTVDRTQETEYWNSLVKLYSRCGFYARRADTPYFKYYSFTPYSDHLWDIDARPAHYVSMFKEAAPDVVYSDGVADVIVDGTGVPNNDKGTFYYYIPIPEHKFNAVRLSGLIPPSHACLHNDGAAQTVEYTDSLIFSRQRPAAGFTLVIVARCSAPTFEMRSAVPTWFAVFIGHVNGLQRMVG